MGEGSAVTIVLLILVVAGLGGFLFWTWARNRGNKGAGAGDLGSPPPSGPPWTGAPTVRLPAGDGMNTWGKAAVDQFKSNITYLRTREGEAKGKPLDIVVYGDEFVQTMRRREAEGASNAWASVFPAKEYGSALLGLPAEGGTVESLAWRLSSQQERPQKDPRVIVLYGGARNLAIAPEREPHKALKELLLWLTQAMPNTYIVVLGLLPDKGGAVKATNAKYSAAVGEVPGNMVSFLDCSSAVEASRVPLLSKAVLTKEERSLDLAVRTAFYKCLKEKLKGLLVTAP